MGLDDRSSWSILSYHTLLFVLLLLFHALLLCLYHRDQKLKKLEGEREHEHAIEKIFKYCTFKMYIPYFQLFFTVMMVSSFTEFTSCLYDDGVEGGSCFFASMIWLACSSVLVIVGWQYFKSQYNYSFSKMKYFKNLFSGLRLSWKSRSYSFLIFARIYAFVILCTIASIVDVKRYHVIRDVNFVMFLTILQMAYMIGTILSFPFKIYTYNIKLIVNEISIATLMVFATRSKEKGGLSDSAGSVLIHMIFFITCAASVFSVGAILVVIYQKIFKSLTKSRIESKSQFERYYEKSQEHSSYIAGSYLTNQPVEKNTEAKTKPKKKKLKKKKLHNKFEEEKVPRFDINEENDAVQF